MNAKEMILQTMLMTQLLILVVLTFPLSFLNYRVSQQKFFNWFGNNHMKANSGKYHLLLSTKSSEVVSIDGIQIISSTAKTLSGITIDSELNFENHLSAICNKVNRKINALGQIANYVPRKTPYCDENIY